jgi:hypothetical protein
VTQASTARSVGRRNGPFCPVPRTTTARHRRGGPRRAAGPCGPVKRRKLGGGGSEVVTVHAAKPPARAHRSPAMFSPTLSPPLSGR